MTTINFSSGGRRIVGNHYVYLRTKWTDDWIYYPRLHCLEAVWSAAPSMSTATVLHDYGALKGVTDAGYDVITKLTARRAYIKIVFETNVVTGETATWHGVVADVEDAHGGHIVVNRKKYASGQQKLYCYGMEYLLAMNDIRQSIVMDAAGVTYTVAMPIEFNQHGQPNRSRVRDRDNVYVFEGGKFYVSPTLPEPNWWSTRDIVQYLMAHVTPVDILPFGAQPIPWSVYGPTNLDDTDRPAIAQEGASVYSLLTRLIDRRRLRTFYVTVVEQDEPEPDYCLLVPFTLTPDWIVINDPHLADIPPNLNQRELAFDGDELTIAIDRTVDTTQYDQVIVRGRHRRSVATFYVANDYLEPAWDSILESEYESAASTAADYATLDDLEKRSRNAEVRGSPRLDQVYSWFKVSDDWDQLAGYDTASKIVFPADDAAVLAYQQYIHGVVLEETLPLLESVDYSANLASVTTPKNQTEMAPFVVFERPGTARYVAGYNIATTLEGETDETDGANNRWSASVNVHADTRVCEINVHGEPQHVIAGSDFAALADDRDLGSWDYRGGGMLVTLCLRDNRRAEAAWPDDSVAGSDYDAMRCKIIYAGDEYKKDYIADETVVDVDKNGDLVICTGGFINDDTDRLLAIAKLVYAWYGTERHAATISTHRLTTRVWLGDIITTIGDWTISGNEHFTTINAPVTEVRFTTPRLDAGQIDEPMMIITTSAGEVDFVGLVPPIPRASKKLPLVVEQTSFSGGKFKAPMA